MLNQPILAHESDEWRATAQRQELNLLSASAPGTKADIPVVPELVTA